MRSVLIRFVVVLGALMLLGCVAAGEAPAVSDAARAASQGVATAAPATPVALPPSVAPALSTEPAPTQEEPTPPATPFDDGEWLTYANARYWFTFRYPADWALQEVTGRRTRWPATLYRWSIGRRCPAVPQYPGSSGLMKRSGLPVPVWDRETWCRWAWSLFWARTSIRSSSCSGAAMG